LSDTILADRDIAAGLGEHLRAVLSLETEALRNTTIPEARNLVYNIFKTDNKVFESKHITGFAAAVNSKKLTITKVYLEMLA